MGKKQPENDLSFTTTEEMVQEIERRSEQMIIFLISEKGDHHVAMKGNRFWMLGVLTKLKSDVEKAIGEGDAPWAEPEGADW